jgi:hypothetical protein
MMGRVKTTLDIAERSLGRARGFVRLPPEGDVRVNVARMRRRAEIDMEFLSGSDRPKLGVAVRFAKRLVRRSLRWYIGPMMAQQSRFNHATLDAIEQLRMRVNQLDAELDQLRRTEPGDLLDDHSSVDYPPVSE